MISEKEVRQHGNKFLKQECLKENADGFCAIVSFKDKTFSLNTHGLSDAQVINVCFGAMHYVLKESTEDSNAALDNMIDVLSGLKK